MKKTLLFYSVIFLVFSIIQKGSGVIVKIVMAKSITPYEYGIITLAAVSLPGLFQLFTNLNFFYILSHAEEGRKYFGFTILYSIIITIFLSILLFFFSKGFFVYLNLPLERWNLLYAVIIISIFSLCITIDIQGLLTGLRVYSLPGIIMSLPSISRLLLIICLIYYNVDSFSLIIMIFALSNAIPLVILLFSKQLRSYLISYKKIVVPSKKMFAFSGALFIVGSFSTVGQYLIKIVVSHELGIEWQGYYDVSLTLASILMFALGTMSFVSIPEATNSDKKAIYEKGGLGDVTRALFSLLVFLLITLFFYSDYIVVKLFSKEYAIGSEYVFILAIGYLFLFVQMFLANLNLSSTKKSKDYIKLSLITLFLIPLFFFLTEYLIYFFKKSGYGNGFIGAYFSYTILLIIYTLITIYYSSDLTPLKILFHRIERLLITFIITFALLYYWNPPALIGIMISGVLFMVLIFLLGYLNKSMIFEIFRGSKT